MSNRTNWLPSSTRPCPLEARACLLVLIMFLAVTATVSDGHFLALGALWVLLVAASAVLGVSWPGLLLRSAVVLPFSLAAVPLLFTVEGPAVAWLAGWPISEPGLLRFLTILGRSLLSLQAVLLVASSLGLLRLLCALSELGVPAVLTSIIRLGWRYLDLLAGELERMQTARRARSAGPGGSLGFRLAVTGQMVGSLFVRTLERSQRTYMAMRSRGYDGHELELSPRQRWRLREYLCTCLAFAGLLLIGLCL